MKLHRIAIAVVVALSAAGAIAQEAATSPLTRTEVRDATLKARQTHQLRPTGEGAQYEGPQSTVSNVPRAEIKGDVIAARRAGELVPAGEGVNLGDDLDAHNSLVTRAEVKQQTLAARRAGELIPAGEGVEVAHHSTPNASVRQAFAKAFGRRDRDAATN